MFFICKQKTHTINSVALRYLKAASKCTQFPATAEHQQGTGLNLPYFLEKVCYRLALRPPVGPAHVPELTLGY